MITNSIINIPKANTYIANDLYMDRFAEQAVLSPNYDKEQKCEEYSKKSEERLGLPDSNIKLRKINSLFQKEETYSSFKQKKRESIGVARQFAQTYRFINNTTQIQTSATKIMKKLNQTRRNAAAKEVERYFRIKKIKNRTSSKITSKMSFTYKTKSPPIRTSKALKIFEEYNERMKIFVIRENQPPEFPQFVKKYYEVINKNKTITKPDFKYFVPQYFEDKRSKNEIPCEIALNEEGISLTSSFIDSLNNLFIFNLKHKKLGFIKDEYCQVLEDEDEIFKNLTKEWIVLSKVKNILKQVLIGEFSQDPITLTDSVRYLLEDLLYTKFNKQTLKFIKHLIHQIEIGKGNEIHVKINKASENNTRADVTNKFIFRYIWNKFVCKFNEMNNIKGKKASEELYEHYFRRFCNDKIQIEHFYNPLCTNKKFKNEKHLYCSKLYLSKIFRNKEIKEMFNTEINNIFDVYFASIEKEIKKFIYLIKQRDDRDRKPKASDKYPYTVYEMTMAIINFKKLLNNIPTFEEE